MSTTSKRLLIGFAAGFLSHVIFQGALGAGLYAAGLIPSLTWSLAPVGPLGVPRTISLGFWAGLWGIAYAWFEPRLTARFGRVSGGAIFGIAPLLGHWFIAQPLRGLGLGGGFNPAMIPIEIAFHVVFGIGLAVILGLSLGLGRQSNAPRVAVRQ
jgi:hypothetical protein